MSSALRHAAAAPHSAADPQQQQQQQLPQQQQQLQQLFRGTTAVLNDVREEDEEEDGSSGKEKVNQLFPRCTPKGTPVGTPTAGKANRTLAEGLETTSKKRGEKKVKKKKKKKQKVKQDQQQQDPLVVVDNIIDLSNDAAGGGATGSDRVLVPPSVFRHDMNQMLNPTTSQSVSASNSAALTAIPSSIALSGAAPAITPMHQSTRIPVGLPAAAATLPHHPHPNPQIPTCADQQQDIHIAAAAVSSASEHAGSNGGSTTTFPYSSGSASSSISGDVRVTPVENRRNPRGVPQPQALRDTKIEIAGIDTYGWELTLVFIGALVSFLLVTASSFHG